MWLRCVLAAQEEDFSNDNSGQIFCENGISTDENCEKEMDPRDRRHENDRKIVSPFRGFPVSVKMEMIMFGLLLDRMCVWMICSGCANMVYFMSAGIRLNGMQWWTPTAMIVTSLVIGEMYRYVADWTMPEQDVAARDFDWFSYYQVENVSQKHQARLDVTTEDLQRLFELRPDRRRKVTDRILSLASDVAHEKSTKQEPEVGTIVKVVSGNYRGQLGTIVETPSFWRFWKRKFIICMDQMEQDSERPMHKICLDRDRFVIYKS